MRRWPRVAIRALHQLAHQQGGYFTAKQAAAVGYSYTHLDYHENAGNFERVGHGLYRLATIPPTEHDDLIRLSLWSRNQKDQPQAVVSHDSALVLHDLSELLPNAIHLTVPVGFRKKPARQCVLHKAALPSRDIEERIGFRVTTPLRTLCDVAESDLSQEQLDKAVKEAVSRGLVRKSKLLAEIKRCPRLDRFRAALNEAAMVS